jgi:aminopeptidase N
MSRAVILAFLTLCISASAQGVSSPTTFVPQPFDVLHYDAEITIRTPSLRELSGVCSMVVKWTEDQPSASLPFHLRYLIVDSVLYHGATVPTAPYGTFELDTFHYRATLGVPAVKDRIDTIHVYYHGETTNEGGSAAWGGVWYEGQVLYVLGVGFKNNYVSATSHWLPCYDHPSDKATVSLGFWIPPSFNVASVGTRTVKGQAGSDSLLYHRWEEQHQIATYLITFAVGPFQELDIVGHASVPHTIFTRQQERDASLVSYKLIPEMTTYFESRFGPYPFDKVGYVNTVKGAMEHQTMISFPTLLVQRRDSVNTTAAHELAHMWWGNLVSPIHFGHAWLTESFATYSEALWVEHLLGWDTYLNSLATGAEEYIRTISRREGVFPMVDFPRATPSSNYPQTIYRKGANVLAMARTLANDDEAFFGALRKYLEDHREGTASTDDMRSALRPVLGSRTDAFFDEWIEGKGWPIITINLRPVNSSTWFAELDQVQFGDHPDWPGVFRTLPLNLTYRNVKGDLIDTVVVMTSGKLVFTIGTPEDFSVNHGSKARSLVEISTITTVMDPTIDNSKIRVVPNPTFDTATVLRSEASEPARIFLVDLEGRTVLTSLFREGEHEHSLNVSSLAAGTYMIRVLSHYAITAVPLHVAR